MPETASRRDPHLAFRFTVTFDGGVSAGFSECSGLKLDNGMTAYAEGGLNAFQHQLPGAHRQGNLVLKRGIVGRELWDWYWTLVQGRVDPRGGSITVRAPRDGGPDVVWEFDAALPTSWEGPSLAAAQSAVAVETLTLVHLGLRRVR